MPDRTAIASGRMIVLVRVLFIAWLTATVIGMLYPDSRMWGLHLPAFLPSWGKATFFATAAIFFLGSFAARWQPVAAIARWAGRAAQTPFPALALLAAFVVFRSAAGLLGDGMLRGGEPELGKYHLQELLPGYLATWGVSVLRPFLDIRGPDVVAAISIMAGCTFLALLWFFPRRIWDNPADRTTTRVIILLGGTTALFFGYIESYAIPCAAAIGVLLAAEAFRRGKSGFSPVIACFVLAVAAHFATVVLYPALVTLGFMKHRNRWAHAAIIALFGLAVAIWGMVILNGEDFVPGAAHRAMIVPLVGGPPLHYGLFSSAHLLDVINLLCLVAPFLLVAAPLLLNRSPVRPAITGGLFWPLAVIIPLAIPLLIDPKLGMARDWDLLSLGVVPLGIYAAITITDRRRALPRGALLLPSVAAAGVLAMFVGINADTNRSIERFEHLLHLDRQRGGYGYEMLAYFYHTRGQADKVIQSWHNALELDNNPRYWLQLSTVYNSLGDRDNALSTARECYFADTSSAVGAYFLANSFNNWDLPDSASRYFHLAARLGPDNVKIQHDLAAFLYLHNRLDEARHYIEAAIALAPDSAAYHNMLGALLIETGELGAAVTTLNRALALRPYDKDCRLNLALAYFLAGQRQQALTELSRVSREPGLTTEEQQAIAALIARIHQTDTASAAEK